MTKQRMIGVGVTLLVVAALSVPAQAQVCEPLDDGRLADAFYEGTVIYWDPVVEFRTMTLTISGPCEDIVKVFGPKDQIMFDIREIERVTDGQYTWSLKREASVDKGVAENLKEARGSGEEQDLWWSYFQAGKIPAGPYTESGAFIVDRGQVVDPASGEEEEKSARVAKAGARAAGLGGAAFAGGVAAEGAGGENTLSSKQTISGDLTVWNSLCVGFDCVADETYSSDTIRLKENNLRIHFDDTSTAGSFPNQDWRIEANSTANGGGEYLRFVDATASRNIVTFEANAPSNSLVVDSGGRVGFGTANPSVELHTVNGDTPTLRLEQDGSSGFQPQRWDVAGNETSFFVRDGTNGSTLPFRIRPSAPSNSLAIDTDGDVGVGTLTSDERLHVKGTDGTTKLLVEEASGTTNGRQMMELRNNGNVNFILTNTAGENWQILAETTGGFPGFSISRQGSGSRELYLDDSGNLEITGEITTSGSCSGGCDLVFDPDYELPSIEEHAAEMFARRHLPSVGPTPEQGPFNLSQKVGGMLNELEKAHVYIAQLSEDKDREVEALRAEIEALKAALREVTEK